MMLIKFIIFTYSRLSKKDRYISIIGLLTNCIAAVTPSLAVYFSSIIIGKLSDGNLNHIYLVTFLFILFTILTTSIASISSFIMDSINDNIWKVTKTTVLNSASKNRNISIFENSEEYKLLNLSLTFSDDIHDSLSSLVAVIFGVFAAIPLIVLLGGMSWWLPIIVIISFTPFMYFISKFERVSWDVKEEFEINFRKMRIFERILTQPEFCKEIRVFGMQNMLIKKWLQSFDEFYNAIQKIRILNTIKILFISFISVVILAIPVFYAVNGYIYNVFSIANIALILGSLYALKESLASIIYNYGDALKISYQIGPYINLSKIPMNSEFKVRNKKMSDNAVLEIKNLFFSYPKNNIQVLNNINLSLRKNTSTVIVGDNGSGKTTLFKLLCGLYDDYRGDIIWNDEIKQPKISVLFQDFAKLPLSVSDNLLIDDENEIEAKNELINMDLDFLSEDLQQILSVELDGRDLSIGQWQKISLIRVILQKKQSDLLLFDEPNSALDPESEEKILELILKLSENRTSIIVSHRMALCKYADNIIVMENGKVIESGSHLDLMEIEGKYYKMYNSQSKYYL